MLTKRKKANNIKVLMANKIELKQKTSLNRAKKKNAFQNDQRHSLLIICNINKLLCNQLHSYKTYKVVPD